MAINPEFTVLLDVYGSVLTEKERNMLDYYYNDDLSLREISDNENIERRRRRAAGEVAVRENDFISRQGVRDTIKRAESKLLDMEQKLGLVRRNRELMELADDIYANSKQTAERAAQLKAPRELIAAIERIGDLAMELENRV